MKHVRRYRNLLLLLPIALLALTACGLFGPGEPDPDPGPSPSGDRLLGLVEVSFRDLGPGQESAVAARAESAPAGLAFTRLETGSLIQDDQRYAYATFAIDNATGAALRNLTFYALSDGDAIGGTALRSLADADGDAIDSASVARALRPTHRMTEVGGAFVVDADNADLQAFTDAEAVSLDRLLEAPDATVLEYGFVAHTPDGSRVIPTGDDRGRVTFAFRVPYDASAPAAQPASFDLAFAVAENGPGYVTRSLEEDPSQVTDACARAAAIGSNQVVVIAKAPATSPTGCSYTVLDEVIYASAAGQLGPAFLTPNDPDPGPGPGPGDEHPTVISVTPESGTNGVPRDSAISVNVELVDSNSLKESSFAGNVTLREVADGTLITGNSNTTAAGNRIIFQPSVLLEANTLYRFEISDGVVDADGNTMEPFSSTFTTGTEPELSTPLFEKQRVASNSLPFTSLTFGPDGRLYAANINGQILRWNVKADGTLGQKQTFQAVQPGRVIIGITFDPVRADPDGTSVLWITHNAPLSNDPSNPAPSFSGEVAKITFQDLREGPFEGVVQPYVVNLPRSAKDHLTNSLAFGPDGFLYLSQGSNSSMGAPDAAWANRPERLLNAAILRIDPNLPNAEHSLPVDVQTEALDGDPGFKPYNPYAAGAPVTIYATGVRNAYDLVWHSNGRLYVPTNGAAAGGNTPADPNHPDPPKTAITNGPDMNDYLFHVVPGGYYGHPNPLRDEYILNGGNPTSNQDPAEVVKQGQYNGYPVGIEPDPNYRGFVYDYGVGRSPNGVVEYASPTPNALNGMLLVVEYSQGDRTVANRPSAENGPVELRASEADGADADSGIRVFDPSGNGAERSLQLRSGPSLSPSNVGDGDPVVSDLRNPLDITLDSNGNLYVTEFTYEFGYITLLKPVTN